MTPAQRAAEETALFVDRLNNAILFPIIYLLMSVAFLVFLYGLAEYVFGAENEQARAQGKSHMMYGFIGLMVMISAWTILYVAAGALGLTDTLNCANNPTSTGCAAVLDVPGP